MNRTLARQLRRFGLTPDTLPEDPAAWAAFLERVEVTYEQADRARYLLERSMEISTTELQQLNAEIRELSRRDIERREQQTMHNFHTLPVAAWMEDFHGAVVEFDGLRANGVTDLGAYIDEDPSRLRDLVAKVVVLDCNPAVCELVGAERADLIGPIDPAYLGEESLAAWRRQFEAIWDHRGRVEIEFRGERTDGTSFPASLKWSVASIDGAFDYSRVMVVIDDLTDRMAAEGRMRDLVTAKDEFLASVSHELRTPLTSVIGYAELLRDVEECSLEHRQMIDTIAEQASDLADIVEDLLVGARSELGQLRVVAEPFDIAAVAGSVAAAFSSVELQPSPGPVWARGDAGRVRQVLRNLVTNAERYGGNDIEMSVRTDADSVVIGVSDDGSALTQEMSEKIFDRYFRRDRDRSRPASVGLGLTISRELAQLMGGDLTYRHDGERAHFELVLGVAPAPAMREAV